jgi:glycosyltransferase involved in cell wall biosynthesis
MKKPIISVIMPVFNAERYIADAIQSILDQTFTNFEFIIINDCSADNSLEIIRHYANIDSRILILNNDKNLGVSRSLNRGINISKANYIARMDADDVSFPNRFEKQINFLEENIDIGVLGTSAVIIDESSSEISSITLPKNHNLIVWFMCYACPLIHPSVMIRKEIFEVVGLYDSYFSSAQDYDLWSRAINITKFSNMTEKLLYLRKHNDNNSNKNKSIQSNLGSETNRKILHSTINRIPKLTPYEFLINPEKLNNKDLQSLFEDALRLLKFGIKLPKITEYEKKFIISNSTIFLKYLRHYAINKQIFRSMHLFSLLKFPIPIGSILLFMIKMSINSNFNNEIENLF